MVLFLLVSCGDVFMSNYGSDEGNLAIRFPGAGDDSGGRAAIPSAGTQALLEYRLTLTSGSGTVSAVVPAGQTSAVLSVTPGVWDIQAEAYLPGSAVMAGAHVGTGSAQVTVVAGQSAAASIKMIFDNTTPESVEVDYMGTTYIAVREGTVYTAVLNAYDTSQPVSITINKAVDDQDILVNNTIITAPFSKTWSELGSPAPGRSTADTNASPAFTVEANAARGYSTAYTVELHFRWPVNTAARVGTDPMDLETLFGIANQTTSDDEEDAFNALHWLINTPEAGDFTQIIQLGDWVDLDSLTVAAYNNAGAISETNTSWSGTHGELLRLIVVGINSFIGINGNTQPHVVFQFQNLPGTRRMNATDTKANGYAGSEMRTYLTGNFLTGLTTAGVPSSVLWAPTRRVANGGAGADAITDLLWLPTEWEMFGAQSYSSWYEINGTASSGPNTLQADFNGYYMTNSRIKYNSSNTAGWYWVASPSTQPNASFACSGSGNNYFLASQVYGCAPAFCVQ
jgi:hypothetical protein